ncbi:MAG: hypothetical protein E7337_16895 [Clostridiales bacterium]|nr:hypothetical protein [Clostridiales bacterium]
MSRIIFYSWQNDLQASTHRYYLDKCIQSALTSLEKEAHVYMEYDRDTMGLMGSPDITESIFSKIDKAVMFVCDISIINSDSSSKKTPNPNVLIELGYAASKLGWERIICLFDSESGKIDELPFDLRQKRITPYNPNNPNEQKRISDIIAHNIKDLFVQGKLFNPLNDYMKGKIDKCFLDIGKQLANLQFGTYSLQEGLSSIRDLLALSEEELVDRISLCEFPAFIMLNTYEETKSQLQEALKEIFTSSYFPKEWAYCVLELLEWIRLYNNLISKRNNNYPLAAKQSDRFMDVAVISGKSINAANSPNSMIVLESVTRDGKRYIDPTHGRVINTVSYPNSAPGELSQCTIIKQEAYKSVIKTVINFIALCKHWLDITDSEFILDPDTYYLT